MLATLMCALLMSSPTQSQGCTAPPQAGSSDALTMRLRLTVEVRSPTGEPQAYVNVRFLDTVPPVGARGEGILLGSTDEHGKLTALIVHTWPDYFRADRRPDVGTFDIAIANQVRHAVVECIPREGDEWRLDLSVVAVEQIVIESRPSR